MPRNVVAPAPVVGHKPPNGLLTDDVRNTSNNVSNHHDLKGVNLDIKSSKGSTATLQGSNGNPAPSQFPQAPCQPPEATGVNKSGWKCVQDDFEVRREVNDVRSVQDGGDKHDDDTGHDETGRDDTVCRRWRVYLRRAAGEVFSSKKFKNPDLERLYQRYFFKLNQTNTVVFNFFVFVAVAIILGFHYGGGGATVLKGVVLAVVMATLVAMELVFMCPAFSQVHLLIVCYISLGLLAVVIVVACTLPDTPSPSEGVWSAIFFIYLVYSLLPIRMRHSVVGGVCLAVLHTVCSAVVYGGDAWTQVSNPNPISSLWFHFLVCSFTSYLMLIVPLS